MNVPRGRPLSAYDGPMRRAVLGLILLIALCFAGQAPAAAASKPGSVGRVSYVAASKTSLSVVWLKASKATKYQIFVSPSYSGVSKAKAIASTKSLKYTVTGLRPGTNYYIQVRAMNGSTAGSRSSRVGHRTVRTQGSATGPYYEVMTYNLCTRVCTENFGKHNSGYYSKGKWSDRMPAATERITAIRPAVVMLQEAQCGWPSAGDYLYNHKDWAPPMKPPAGYATVGCRSAKQLYYYDARFDRAPGEECRTVDDPYPIPAVPADQCAWGSVFLGHHDGGDRYALWAELIDTTAANKHIIFVSVHLVVGTSDQRVAERKAETYKLLAEIKRVNAENYPVVYGGDFNSHKGRANDSVATAFHNRGYLDSYDLAMKFRAQHYNSYNDFSTIPRIGMKWGDHVDHVWVDPTRSRVMSWVNAATLVGGRYPHPIPSDHNPVVATIQVN